MTNLEETRPAASEDPDIELMLAFQKGERSAFEALLRKHYRNVLNFCYRFLGRRDSAEDITHEVFLKAYQSAAGYQPRARFRTWLYTIAKNLCLNELRSKVYQMNSWDEAGDREAEEPNGLPEDLQPPEDRVLRKERRAAIRAAIDELPENQRLAVILRRYDDFSYEEIAAALGISEKAVKSLLNRAKEHLRKKLAPWVEKSPPRPKLF
jgi:RNA polymerase sigma-70 factor (ECF subfamily)